MNLVKSLLATLTFCFLSCNKIPEEVQQTLDLAGTNKHELQAVLDHYKAPKDSLKLKAAYFLLAKEVLYGFGFDSKNEKTLGNYFKALNDSLKPYFGKENLSNFKEREEIIQKIIAQYNLNEGSVFKGRFDIVRDIDAVTASFLIENIDYAFMAWELPWAKQYSFDEFCQYVLPYRSGYEYLNPWRKYFFDEFKPLRDTIGNETDPLKVTTIIDNYLNNRKAVPSGLYALPEALLGTKSYKYNIFGNCVSISMLKQEIMRSQGIAISELWFNKFGDSGRDHISNIVLDNHNKWYTLRSPLTPLKDIEIKHSPVKLYRREAITATKHPGHEIKARQRLGTIGWVDITKQITECFDVTPNLLPQNCSTLNNQKIAYLCIFDNRIWGTWTPIAWSVLKNNKTQVTFTDIAGKGVVYITMVEDENNQLIPISQPFILTQGGELNYLSVTKSTININLTRKYPHKRHLVNIAKSLEGAYFEASNTPNFNSPKKLYTIDSIENADVIVKTIEPQNFRYYRFVVPSTEKKKSYHLAELAFGSSINNTFNKIEGTVIASANTNPMALETFFDENLLTYTSFNKKSDTQSGILWIGVDFGKKQKISELYLCPRTDKNAIYPNMDYELLYWDTNWVSCGIKQSNNGILTYNNMPSGTLYWLRNLTEGREERIFTYQNNKQVWW